MPGQRIGRHENLVVVKFDSETLAGRCNFGIHDQGPLPTAEFLGPVGFAIHALNRHVGIELEGSPNDFGSELLAKEFEGCLHPTITDIAPGADEPRRAR
jgi:hypothetical protein